MTLGLLVWVGWSLVAVSTPAAAFLPTILDYSDPDLEQFFCPSQMTGDTWDHKAITREALRLEVRRYFLENPPPSSNGSFTIPEDASLSQIFRAYYGPTSSPTRFIKAVNSITWSNAMTEASGQLRYSAPYHMDGESILQGHQLLQGRYQQLIKTITVDESYNFARELLGASLNGIQDFYSQSTWLELGNTGVLKALGLPGEDIGEVAGRSDATCTNCEDPIGSCSNNVIPGSKLSSGYYEYTALGADSLLVPKPVGAGKCSHGGSMDTSVMTEATGGINKETTSPCFSPHHHLHQQAVDLAIKASESYISTLRDAVGDDHFLNLLDLYRGSALSIVIDKTLSMAQEINAVKEEAKLIVEKTHPELFVFVPFGDPNFGPVTKTTNATEFLQVLEDLELDAGCCCLEEKFWHGLQLALINTPDYSNVYCFTDAGANDAEIMEGVMALASSKHSKVSIIYSYDNGYDKQGRACPGYTVSGTDELKKLAAISGGQFIEIDKFDIDDIVGILETGVEESKVGIRARDGVTGHHEVNFPIDDSIIDFSIVITGTITGATLTDEKGKWYDLMDEAALNATSNVEVISHTDSLKVIAFTSPRLGEWALEMDGSNEYSVSVSATSTLGFLASFAELELQPPRPSYVVSYGRPLIGKQYYVEVMLVGYLESQVDIVTAMEFVDEKGVVLSHVNYHGMLDDLFYILSEDLPGVPFYIQIDGFIQTGNPFSRLFPTMTLAVECRVELLVEESVLYAKPGQSTKAYFRVHNFGPEAQFEYTAVDEEGYIFTWLPKASTIPSLGTEDVEVHFRVPSNAPPGTTSTVTFTAASLISSTNVNTYITHYLVIDTEQDTAPPTCISTDNPDCSGYDTEGTCGQRDWSVSATLQDTLSGLNRVYSRPEEGLILDGFVESTTDPVGATFSASCCVRSLEIIGVDEMGNIGRCHWDLGSLQTTTTIAPTTKPTTPEATPPTTNTPTPEATTHTIPASTTTTPIDPSLPSGWVIEFVAEAVGETWVELRWTVTQVPDDLYKYVILVDNDISAESRCRELVCRTNVTYLESCTLHTFSLTPQFHSADGGTQDGSKLYTDATTLGAVPGAPTNPSTEYATVTTTTVTWDPPAKTACIHHYQVCFRMYGESESECVESSTNTCTMEGLEACTIYHVTVASVSTSGEHSDPLKFDTNTDDAAPGAPENLQLVNQTDSWVELSWDDPLERASCVDRWAISYAKTPSKIEAVVVSTHPTHNHGTELGPLQKADNYATVSDLLGCTNYTFWVSAVSPKGTPGGTKNTRTAMDETEPTPVLALEARTMDTSSVSASWTPAQVEMCVDHYRVCITDVIDLTKECHDTNDYDKIFTGLDACVEYEVTVTSVSPSGRLGGFAYDLAKTEDLPTSAPTDLQVEQLTSHSVLVSFGLPLEHPRCVNEFRFKLVLLKGLFYKRETGVTTHMQETLSDLDACSHYGLWISAVTISGFESDQVNQNFTTSEDTPSAPREFKYFEVSPEQVMLQWFWPEANKMCAETYRLSWTSDGDSGSEDLTYPGHPPEVTVTRRGLTPCKDYTFSVSAVTLLGVSGPAATLTLTTTCY
ncbi:uncharacterized protein [Panulirus ornatus]|uniref:uncharacterized protein n=1 Tax=Panulirus ornatus TaxID=150431 RepID=UPI003A8B7269